LGELNQKRFYNPALFAIIKIETSLKGYGYMKYSTVLFDFDGTLADSSKAILPCVLYTYEKLGKQAPDLSRIHKFIGPPLADSFRIIGLEEQYVERAVELYREFFNKTHVMDIKLFDGIESLLEKLKDACVRMAVTSIRVEDKLGLVCDSVGLNRYIPVVCGRVAEEGVLEKADVVRRALDRLGNPKEGILLVGDSKFDEDGAAGVGIDFAAVMYGFGYESRDEIEKSVCIADSVEELAAFILED
jgi:phosphoglycolate phosphatase